MKREREGQKELYNICNAVVRLMGDSEGRERERERERGWWEGVREERERHRN